MPTMRPLAAVRTSAAGSQPTSGLPVVRPRTTHRGLEPRVDHARRELWRAFQRGALSEDEFAALLERLDFGGEKDGPGAGSGVAERSAWAG
jgi:hypothetical protein